jgi:hypothetical protein
MWRRWSDLASFNLWHTAACDALGIPHPGNNAATGNIDQQAQWTTAYTSVIEVGPDDWRAVVKPQVAELVPTGLGAPSDPPPEPDLDDLG